MFEKKHRTTVVQPKVNASPFGISSPRPDRHRAAPENAGSGHRFSDLRIHPAIAERIEAASGKGDPLDRALRTRLEAGLGSDLGAARIHNDPAADALARSLDARAFTTGPDIFFRAGVYDPASPEGMGTLVHESAHVLQQQAARPNTGPDMSVGARNDGFEQAARQAVARFNGNVPALLNAYPSASAPMIQRQPFDEGAALPPNINPFGPTEPPPVNPVGPTEFPELPPGGVPDPLNPTFPKPPGVPNIPEPPPGGFPQAPPTPATGASGGGFLETLGGILGAIGGTLFDFFPPVRRSILPGGQTPEA